METEARKLALKQSREGKDPFRANAKSDPLQAKLVETDTEIEKLTKAGASKREQLRADPNNEELRREVRAENQRLAQLQNQKATVAQAISITLGGNQHTLPLPEELNK